MSDAVPTTRCVRFAHLPRGVFEQQVMALALPFGPVREVKMLGRKGFRSGHQQQQPAQQGFEALVTFEDPEDAAAARDNLAGSEYAGAVIAVSFADEAELRAMDRDPRKAVWAEVDESTPASGTAPVKPSMR
mmetsp:Transcript_3900/g.6869  ORF Transcript_3900/g.6869 Transcript_3900/m.6869 type:complete len:132 (+) Transcript_3900:71-466(+)